MAIDEELGVSQAPVAVIWNPQAGRGRSGKIFRQLHDSLRSVVGDFTSMESRMAGHPRELAVQAARQRVDRLVVFGGDGTVHEVINGLMDVAASIPGLPAVGIIPSGTGNDLARNLGLPHSKPTEALNTLRNPTALRIDLGRVDKRHFVNFAGVGFSAEAARRANALPQTLPGPMSYIAGVVGAVMGFTGERFRLELDGEVWEDRLFMVHVANAPYCAGGMRLAPDARMDDKLLDLMLLRTIGRLELLRVLPATFSGAHVHHPKVLLHTGRSLRVSAEHPFTAVADGEVLGNQRQIDFQVVPDAVTLLT